MLRYPAIFFPRRVEVAAGEEKYEPCTLTNDSSQHERFLLRIAEGEAAGEDDPVVADLTVARYAREDLELALTTPPDSRPGLFPFTILADLEHRGLRLKMPGLIVVPPLGGWQADVTPNTEALLRPWHIGGADFEILLRNRSNDWLFVEIRLENTNGAWAYGLATRIACLPPWPDANVRYGRDVNSFTHALQQGAVPEAQQASPPPEQRVPLTMRPKRMRWFGSAGQAAETYVVVHVARLNPETGRVLADVEFAARARYQPIRSPLDILRGLWAIIAGTRNFWRFLFSRWGFLTVLAVVVLVMMVRQGGPVNLYQDTQDFLFRPNVATFRAKQEQVVEGDLVEVEYRAENADWVEITGGPSGKMESKTTEGIYKFRVPSSKPVWVLQIKAQRRRVRGNQLHIGREAAGRNVVQIQVIPRR